MNSLQDLGFSAFFSIQLNEEDFTGSRIARIIAVHRDRCVGISEEGTGPVLFPSKTATVGNDELLPKVGDWVVLAASLEAGNPVRIERILERRTVLRRGASGHETRSQVIAANIDTVFITTSLDADFSLNRIERYLSMVWSSGATPVVLLNKADQCEDGPEKQYDIELRNPGVEALLVSALNQDDIATIRSRIPSGQTACFVGSSGVGKSTMINALIGEQRLATNAVREGDQKGRHTTTHRELFVLPDGGMVIDTPGMRELQLMEEAGIESAFPDIEKLAVKCRFADCSHESEPGCAVRTAVDNGDLDPERLDNYLKLQHESRAFEIRHDAHLRKQSEKVWGQLKKEGELIRRMKRSR